MRRRVQSLLRSPRLQGAGDALLAAVLAITSVAPVLHGDPSWGRPKSLGVALALLSTVPIAWRARRPLTVAAIVLAAQAACIYVAAPDQAAFQPFVALVLAAYSVGSRAEGRRALWVPPVLAAAAIPVFVAAVLHGQDAGNAIPSFVWLLAAWAVGRSVRSWRLKSIALELANRELAEQRELQAQAAVTVERGRIARELHNVVAHNVSMMVVQAGAAARVLHGEQPDVRNALDVIAATGRQTVDDMRTLLGVLRSDDGPDALKPQPGLADLERLVGGVREAGLPVTLRFEGAQRPLPPAIDMSAFRIVQEALTNTLKHAGPAQAQVTVRYQDAAVELEIVDTGRGLALARGPAPDSPGRRAGAGPGTAWSVCASGRRCSAASSRRPRPTAAVSPSGRDSPSRPPRDPGDVRVIRVLLADDQALVRGGFRLILDAEPDMEVVAEAADGNEAVTGALESQPDLVLMDIRMPVLDGIEATRRLLPQLGATRVVMLTTFDLDDYVVDAFRAGASGFLLKTAPPPQLVAAIRTVHAGDALLAPASTRRLIEQFARPAGPAPALEALTSREHDVLRLLARGLTNAEIAEQFVVEPSTVKSHVASVLAKLGLRDRVQAVVFAYESGLVRPGTA